jgi:drug/metabolite transporter (DMT)-like permease
MQEKPRALSLQQAAPTLFVLLWSTGFIGSKLGSLYAEPFTMTALRMLLVTLLLTLIVWLMRAPWPAQRKDFLHLMMAGALIHACYLTGVLYALRLGLPTAYVAMIAGVQPVLTALLARLWLRERLSALQWLGMALGLSGVLLVVLGRYQAQSLAGISAGLGAAVIALIGITLGTLYQKRYCSAIDLRTGALVQYASTTLLCTLLAFAFESRSVQWHAEFVFALLWLAVVLSLGAIGLLFYLIRRGASAQVASLFFLTPSVTAVLAYLLFEEGLSHAALFGFGLTALGVMLVARAQTQPASQ